MGDWSIDNGYADNAQTDKINGADRRRIVINITDNGIALTCEGVGQSEAISLLELSKHYIITKTVGHNCSIDVVKRK